VLDDNITITGSGFNVEERHPHSEDDVPITFIKHLMIPTTSFSFFDAVSRSQLGGSKGVSVVFHNHELDVSFASLGNVTSIVVFSEFRNSERQFDVNSDELTSPTDAILIINELAMRRISDTGTGDTLDSEYTPATGFVDVSNDGRVSPIDALLVINQLNTPHLPLSVPEPISTLPIALAGIVVAVRLHSNAMHGLRKHRNGSDCAG
jgi:hypothetical protein